MSKRAEYVRKAYTLRFENGQWVARGPFTTIAGKDRAWVVRKFRAQCGHFNFDDEARAFDETFGVGISL